MIIVITYLLINSWDFIFKRSMRIIHLKKSVGSVPCSIVYLLRKRPMTLSTWIRTLAIPFVVSTSTGSSCSLPLVKVATTDFALLNTTLSCIVKPQSAITMLLGTNLLKIPQFSVKKLFWGSTTPCLKNKWNSTLWSDANQDFDGIMMFVGAECLCSSK